MARFFFALFFLALALVLQAPAEGEASHFYPVHTLHRAWVEALSGIDSLAICLQAFSDVYSWLPRKKCGLEDPPYLSSLRARTVCSTLRPVCAAASNQGVHCPTWIVNHGR